jgi:glycosyltransferase involved in cell wall biosynthesis
VFGQEPKVPLESKFVKKLFINATPELIRNIFNTSHAFISASNTEGLNMPPVEATLCGCPSVLQDGAFGELYINGMNCFHAQDEQEIYDFTEEILQNPCYREQFRKDMEERVKMHTWGNVIKNLIPFIKD